MSKTTILDNFYTRESWYSEGTWHSVEQGVKPGEVRVIDDRLCYASHISRTKLRKQEVTWHPVRPQYLRDYSKREEV